MMNDEVERALALAIDMLDRVDGTTLYNIQKKFYGYSDSEYQEHIRVLLKVYEYLKKRRESQ